MSEAAADTGWARRWFGKLTKLFAIRGAAPNPMREALAEAEDKATAAEWKAQQAHDRLRDAIDALPEGIVFLDSEGRYILWNERYAELYRNTADLFQVGARFEDALRTGVYRGDYPGAVGHEEEWLADRLEKFRHPGSRHEQQLADGRWVMIEERRTREGGTIGIRVDVTEMKRREASFRTLFEDNPVPMVVHDRATLAILAVNRAALDLYGYVQEDMLRMRLSDLWIDETGGRDGADATLGGVDETDQHRRADGTPIDVAVFSRPLVYEGASAVIVSVIDVTERRRAEARIAHMTRHDALTDLPNRMFYGEQVEDMLRAEKPGFAVLLVDLDHFKGVNDTLGHSVGDELLRILAVRLRKLVGLGSTVARLGGDEFAFLLAGMAEPDKVDAFARQVIAAIMEPYEVEGHRLVVGASVGVAMAPGDAAEAEGLLKCADLALYRAKADGRGTCRFFEPEMDARMRARRALETDLRRAVAEGTIDVHYQPIVDIASGKIAGFEALLRWTHPERGVVPPETFVAVAEETGLIGQLGEYVLSKAARDALLWPKDVKVAVNLSPMHFRSGSVVSAVTAALEASGLAANRLEVEITESLMIERNQATLTALEALRTLGVGISMDDFGTGYSSLSYLSSFPFTKIKIDQSFVLDLAERPDRQAIVRAIIGLGTSLGMTVTAEGVERAEDLVLLRAQGCTEAQGYLFSPARTIEEACALLARDGGCYAA